MTYDHWKTRSDRDDRDRYHPEEPPFICPICGFESFNPNDKRERYCVRRHVFIDDALDAPLKSVAIERLIKEVRNEGAETPRSYNRIYNRHNR
jgi:hypothetical protein